MLDIVLGLIALWRKRMRIMLGWIGFVVALAFAVGQFGGMYRITWSPSPYLDGPTIFFGFGVPMVAVTSGTYKLWQTSRWHLRMLGWTCTMVGLAWAVCLLVLVFGWSGLAGSQSSTVTATRDVSDLLTKFAGFATPMVVAGWAGLVILLSSEAASTANYH